MSKISPVDLSPGAYSLAMLSYLCIVTGYLPPSFTEGEGGLEIQKLLGGQGIRRWGPFPSVSRLLFPLFPFFLRALGI